MARFRDLDALRDAEARLRDTGCERLVSYTPFEPSTEGTAAEASMLPLFILLGGLAGGIGFFLLQSYSDVWAYPMNIGGRPNFSWPPYIANAFEVGVLCAVTTGFVGFLIASGLPRLYEPADRFFMSSDASRDGYLLLVETSDPTRHRALIEALGPLRIEEMA
jgi:hypothetical protein